MRTKFREAVGPTVLEELARPADARVRLASAMIAVLSAIFVGAAVYLWSADSDKGAQVLAVDSSATRAGLLPSVAAASEGNPSDGLSLARAQQLERLLADFYAIAGPGGHKGQPPYADFVAGMEAGNLSVFLELLDRIRGASFVTERSRLLLAIAHRWAGLDRPAALQYAMGLSPRTRNVVLSALLVSWAETDRDAAWSYVASTFDLHASDSSLNALAEMLANASYRDHGWALERLKSVPPGPAAERAAERLFAAQAAVDVERASAWLDQLSPELHDHALFSIVMHYGASAPKRALETLAKLSLPQEKLSRSAGRLTSVWTAASPAQVAVWVDNAPLSPLFTSVASTLAEQWSRENPYEAGQWLANHREDSAYLPALKSHLAVLAADNFAAAGQWIDAIQNADTRGALITELERLGLTPSPAPVKQPR